jgi:16S rRNA C1402 (ribose-2'-O) methylase RsmI
MKHATRAFHGFLGAVKPYKGRELNKLKRFEWMSRVTIKYESPNRYYSLIPVIVYKKKKK